MWRAHTHSQGLNYIGGAGRLLSVEGSLDLMPCLTLLTAPHISREGIEPWRGRVCVRARCDWLDWLQLVTHTQSWSVLKRKEVTKLLLLLLISSLLLRSYKSP